MANSGICSLSSSPRLAPGAKSAVILLSSFNIVSLDMAYPLFCTMIRCSDGYQEVFASRHQYIARYENYPIILNRYFSPETNERIATADHGIMHLGYRKYMSYPPPPADESTPAAFPAMPVHRQGARGCASAVWIYSERAAHPYAGEVRH